MTRDIIMIIDMQETQRHTSRIFSFLSTLTLLMPSLKEQESQEALHRFICMRAHTHTHTQTDGDTLVDLES